MHPSSDVARRRGRPRTAVLLAGLLILATAVPPSAVGAEPGTVSLRFFPEADTYVSETAPDRSYGANTSLYVDAAPIREIFLRFDIGGLREREVTRVRLRLHQKDTDGSPLGGEVRSVSDHSWDDSITWNTRPQIDGPLVGWFDEVSLGRYYETDLDVSIPGDGPLSLAITSWDGDAAVWSSTEGTHYPELIVDVAAGPLTLHDGRRLVSDDFSASSDPTYFGNAHRLGTTRNGRLILAHGRHANGVQLQWRDPGGSWQMRSRGTVDNGLLEDEAGTGDVPASIVVGQDERGVEHAWVVWAGASADGRPLEMKRISDLDHPDGPWAGPTVVLDDTDLGAARPDIMIEQGPDGSDRVFVVYTRRVGPSAFQLVLRVIEDLEAVEPQASDPIILHEDRSSKRTATLVSTTAGLRLVAILEEGNLGVLSRQAGSPSERWERSLTGLVTTGDISYPTATALASGRILAATTSSAVPPAVAVVRIGQGGSASSLETTFPGYLHPSIASDGDRSWLFMVRQRDGAVVSRERGPDGRWSAHDRVEFGAQDGEMHWPNALRNGPRIVVVASRPGGTLGRAAVLELTRTPAPLPSAAPDVREARGASKHAAGPPRHVATGRSVLGSGG